MAAPLNTVLPTLDMGVTSWTGTVGSWDENGGGTISYSWELRLVEDDSVVESGGGSLPQGTGTYNNTNGYYLKVDATNTGGTTEARSKVGTLGVGLVRYHDLSDGTSNSLTRLGSATSKYLWRRLSPVTGTSPRGDGCVDLLDNSTTNKYQLDSGNIAPDYVDSWGDPFTVNVWAYKHSLSSTGNWIANHRDNGSRRYWQITSNSDTAICSVWNGSAFASAYSTSGSFPNGTWVMITLRFTGSAVETYVNGSLEATTPFTLQSAPSGVAPFYLGVSAWGSTNSGTKHRGQLWAFGMWSRAIGPAEIAELYNEGQGLLTDDLLPEGLGDEVAWYCPSLVNSPNDISGNGNDGTYQGGMATVADADPTYGGSRAYDFDGVDDNLFVSVSNNQWYPYEVTRSMWVKSSDPGTGLDYFREYGISGNPKLRMQLRHGSAPLMHLDYDNNSAGTERLTTNGLNVATGNWTHVAVTYKQNGGFAAPTGTDVDIYINGSLYVSYTGADACATAGRVEAEQVTHELNIGVAGGLTCQMDDIRIYDRILTDTEITHLATARGVEGPPGTPASIPLDYLWSPTQGAETSLGPIANIGTAGTQDLTVVDNSGTMAWVSDTDKDGLYAADIASSDHYHWDPFSTPVSSVTTGIWVKCDDADESGYIMSLGSNTASLFLAAEFRVSGNIRLWAGGISTQVSDGGITKTDWNHIALTYDQTTARLFVNGVEIASAAASAPATYNEIQFGTGGASVFGVEGRIDGMFLEYSVLTDSEIAALAVDRTYPTDLTPPPSGTWHNPFRNSFFYNPFFDNEAL